MKKNKKKLVKAVAAIEWLANCEVAMLAYNESDEKVMEKKFLKFTLTNEVDILEVLPITAVGPGAVLDYARGMHNALKKFLKLSGSSSVSLKVVLTSDELNRCPNYLPSEIDACDVRSFDSLCGWLAYVVERYNALYALMKSYPKYKSNCPF